jgi:hypothetical protein
MNDFVQEQRNKPMSNTEGGLEADVEIEKLNRYVYQIDSSKQDV